MRRPNNRLFLSLFVFSFTSLLHSFRSLHHRIDTFFWIFSAAVAAVAFILVAH
jgi:hypothetical protein